MLLGSPPDMVHGASSRRTTPSYVRLHVYALRLSSAFLLYTIFRKKTSLFFGFPPKTGKNRRGKGCAGQFKGRNHKVDAKGRFQKDSYKKQPPLRGLLRVPKKYSLANCTKRVWFAGANKPWRKTWEILTRHFASKMTCARHQASLMTASAGGLRAAFFLYGSRPRREK